MIFETKELSIGYSGKTVVSGINVSLKKGEILSVIGPNGSGKSTFLKTVSGQLAPIKGDVLIDGKKLSLIKSEELSKSVSLLLTDRIKPEYMTARELIESGRYPYTGRFGILSDEDRKKADEIIELTGTAYLSDRLYCSLSDGEKQRILFARALCQEPELLIMDEPMSYLDIKYKLEMVDIIKQLCLENGVSVIMSVHEVFLAGKISDRILSFKNNKIFRYGDPEDVFKDEIIMELYDIDEKAYSLIKSGYVLE